MSSVRLEKIANSNFDFKASKLRLLERIDSQLVFTHNGGLFKATPTLLSLLDVYINAGYDTIIILDEYQNPISVAVLDCKHEAMESHQYAMNAYQQEFNDLKKVRKGDKL